MAVCVGAGHHTGRVSGTDLALIFGLGFLGLGLVFAVIGWLRIRLVRDWTSTSGLIVDRRTGLPTGMSSGYPTFQWADQSGRRHQRTSAVRQSFAPRPGTRVSVRYDPTQPERAMINTSVQNGTIFLVVGAVLAVVGIVTGAFLLYWAPLIDAL